MKKYFKIGLMLLFTMALLFVVAPKATSVDDDVGITYVMPQDQMNVDIVFIADIQPVYVQQSYAIYSNIEFISFPGWTVTQSPGLIIYNDVGMCSLSNNQMITEIEAENSNSTQLVMREYRLDIGEICLDSC